MSQSTCAYLKCHALLEHARSVSESSLSVYFDGVIRCSQTVHDIPGPFLCANLHYIKTDSTQTFPPGIYDVDAKVVMFVPRTHLPSPSRSDRDFALMGDISELHPLSTQPEQIQNGSTVAQMTVSGRVSRIQPDIDTFLMTIRQPLIQPAPQVCRLNIRALMGFDHLHNLPLPSPNSVVTFRGQLLTFQSRVAIITVDDIAYVAGPLDTREILTPHPYAHLLHDMQAGFDFDEASISPDDAGFGQDMEALD